MGFKRTPEGRVFFQGADEPQESPSHETANDEPPRPNAPSRRPLMSEQARNAAVSQTQIVTLLKTLNERLKLTQADRDQMMRELEKHRSVIEDLEDKAERNERIALDLEHKLERQTLAGGSEDILQEFEKTRALLLEKQNALESKQTQQHKLLADSLTQTASSFAALSSRLKTTETRQIEIDEKVEAAALQQAKLMRKVEKAIEDRARFMRKIERIEETVIQTRDSLNAKAMVLLTDQGVAGQEDITEEALHDPAMIEALRSRENAREQDAATTIKPEKDPFTSPLFTGKEKEQDSAWRYAAIVAGVAALGVIGFLAYENLSADNQSTSPRFNEDQFSELSAKDAGWQAVNIEPAAGADSAAQDDLPPLGAPQPIESMNWAIEETSNEETANSEPQEQTTAEETAAAAVNDDVGAIDLQNEEEVAALLENNPEALARQLNEIEPERTTTEETAPVTTTQPPVIEEKPAEETTAKAAPAKTESQLRSLIKNDPNLPNVVKAIEDQAFEGIPEAQHDLAAIYTAGHGGVEQNYKRAAFWFERAAENGIANASYNLGVLYHQGLGFDADINKALKWYKQAAAQGHPEAQYNLGIAHIEGIGVEYDAEKAAGYFAAAADNGIMEAAYNLGLIYENGLLGDSNPDNALLWYKQAADQGSPEAREALQGLAQRLGLSDEDVNRLVESIRAADDIRQGTTTAPEKETNIAPLNTQDNQALTAQIQEYLMRSGLYPGPADGIGGPVTLDAIRSYQAQHGLNADGKVTQALLSHMLSNSG